MARNVERHTQLSHARSIASTLPTTETDSTDDMPQILTDDGTLLHWDHFLFNLHFHSHSHSRPQPQSSKPNYKIINSLFMYVFIWLINKASINLITML